MYVYLYMYIATPLDYSYYWYYLSLLLLLLSAERILYNGSPIFPFFLFLFYASFLELFSRRNGPLCFILDYQAKIKKGGLVLLGKGKQKQKNKRTSFDLSKRNILSPQIKREINVSASYWRWVLNCFLFFSFIVTSIRKRSRSNAPIAVKVSANRGRWPSIAFCTWKSRRTSAPFALAASISDQTSRPTCWRTPTSNPTSALHARKSSGAIAISGGTLWLILSAAKVTWRWLAFRVSMTTIASLIAPMKSTLTSKMKRLHLPSLPTPKVASVRHHWTKTNHRHIITIRWAVASCRKRAEDSPSTTSWDVERMFLHHVDYHHHTTPFRT